MTNVQHYVRGGRKLHNMSGSRCLHVPHIASSDVFQPTCLIMFALNISILPASVVAEQGLMQGLGSSTLSAVWSYSGLCNRVTVYRYEFITADHNYCVTESKAEYFKAD